MSAINYKLSVSILILFTIYTPLLMSAKNLPRIIKAISITINLGNMNSSSEHSTFFVCKCRKVENIRKKKLKNGKVENISKKRFG